MKIEEGEERLRRRTYRFRINMNVELDDWIAATCTG